VNGLPLTEAFRKFVLEDPILVAAIRKASRECWTDCRFVLSGYFNEGDPFWPVSFTKTDLLRAWNGPQEVDDEEEFEDQKFSFGRYSSPTADDRAAEIVQDRVHRFLAPLRCRQLLATGHGGDGNGPLTRISTALWSRPSTQVDFIEGTIFRVVDGGASREWTGLLLGAGDEHPAPIGTEKPSRKGIGGPKLKYDWVGAVDKLWERIELEGHPKDGPTLVRWMEAAFGGAELAPDESTLRKFLREDMPLLWRRHVSE
jgi:hypothetical protein